MFLGFDHWFVLLSFGIRLGLRLGLFTYVRSELHLVLELSFVGVFNSLFFNILFFFWSFSSRLGVINGL
jgi:hypothetical protein